ncbi:MAG: right-handed parallel beta-helix repeat-containing protein [Ferruginibacter sp.]|nr:right-handed parallel beta-helix repeat-containing protein [Ferruginibacter sp.]
MRSKNLPLDLRINSVTYKWILFALAGFISFLFSLSLNAQSSLIGAYTINKTVPTGGTNFNSFKDFSDALTATGVTGNVTATVVAGTGPYNEQVIFQNIAGIGAAATVTIQGSGETITSDTAINQTGSNPNRHIIRLIGLQYFTINNLHINMFPGSTGFIGVHILNSGNNITISNCVVDMGSATSTLLGAFVANGIASSILTPGGTFNIINITGNTVTGGGYGASVNGLASPLATNVVISNNNFNDFNSNGVYLRETDGAVVSGNHFDKSAGSTASTNAIQLAQAANVNGRIFGNFIKMSQTSGSLVGIYLFNGTGHKVYNNLIYDIRSTNGTIEGIRVRTGGTAPEIYFNTVSFDNATATSGNLKGFREELSNTNSVLRNNIFSITQTTSGTKTAIELASTSTVTSAINSNYNVFWVPGGNVGMRGATVYATLNAWQTASTQDAASFETNPSFQSVTNPVPRSGVINNQALPGTGITTDITGATRSATPDPGAYEFTPPSGDAAITNFILPPIPHCANTLAVQFELTNAGGDPLNSVTINWTVNGVPQAAVNWTGPTVPPGASTIVTLGTIPVTGATIYNFTATSSNPNGGPDSNPSNDSYTYNGFRRGLEGVFTINASLPVSTTNFTGFQSMANALSQHGICTPVVINVMNGPYDEQVVFNTVPGSSAVNTITLNGNSQVLQYNPTNAASDHILQLNGVNHMIVENLTVNSLHATQGRGIHITNGSSKITIRNNTVNVSTTNSTSSAFGIIISGANWLLDGSLSDSVVISGNTVSGGYSAIQLSGVHWNTPLTRISVINNNVFDWYGFGVYLSYTNGALVSRNIIRRPTRTNSGSDAVTPAGITVPAGSLAFLLEKNRIYDLHVSMPGSSTISRGVYMSGTTTAPTSGTIQNNLIYGMNNDGAQYGIQNNSVTGPVNIYHNTIVLNNATGAGTSNTNAINLSNFSTQNGLDMRNNIFVVTRGGTGVKRIIDVSASAAPFISNYNAAWLNAPGGTQTYGQIGSTSYITFGDWQTGTGKDANSVHADPLFTNPGAGNFAPANPVVDGAAMGTTAVGGITDDILNVVRAVNPDPGAFEFTPPACTTPVGGTANTSSGPFCTSGTGTVMATGYSAGNGISYQWQYSNDNFVSNINDLAGQTNPASASTGVITSTTYYRLKVTCSSGPSTAFSNIVTITVNQPVTITTNPVSQTVCAGVNVTFTVAATGTSLTYQWRKNGGNIGGANAASYIINNVTTGDAGDYDVVVTGACGPVTSNSAALTVNASTAITTQPVNQVVCVGANVTFTVVVSGTSLTYQWRKNGGNIGGANAASYTINNVTAGDAGNYDVVINGACGNITSTTATLTVNATTVISTQPASQTVCAGGNATFTVAASGTSLTYQWRKNGGNINGANAASYTINNVTIGDAGDYDVVVTGSCGPVTSSTATLTVNSISVAAVSANSDITSSCGPAIVNLSITGGFLGTGASWKWYSGSCGGALLGTGATLSNVAVNTSTTFFVRAEGTCNTTSCASVTVTTTAAPSISILASPYTSLLPGMFTTLTATITPPGPTNTIAWYRNGIAVPGASGSTLRVGVDELGLYTARVTTALNCTALSNAVNIKDSASNRLFITPNPNSGVFQVRYYSGAVNPGTTRSLVIYGNNGQRVYIKSFTVTAPYSIMDVSAGPLAGGVYVVAVMDSNGKVLATGKVVLQ